MTRRNRQLKAWERRRRRRIRIFWLILLLIAIAVAAVILIHAAMPYEQADLCELFTIEYGGYNTNGTAEAIMNDAAVDELLSKVKEDYDNAWIHYTNPDPEDYVKFRSSLVANLSATSGLSNGSAVSLTVAYDKKLADKLKIDVTSINDVYTVDSLVRATVLSVDQMFADVNVEFSGISPQLTATVSNNSTHPFLSTVLYEIVEPREYYSEGNEVKVVAIYDADAAFEKQYVVDAPDTGCAKIYTATSDAKYVSSYTDIPSSLVSEAVEAGKAAFVNANEYGVRIFCEGNLVPVYINKQATFEWGSARALSAYFKAVLPENAGKLGNNYNDLDVIYETSLTQADGKSCKCYCAVRFSNIVMNGDGSLSYDFSNPKIMSASYFSARVKKNVVDSYMGDYEIEKVL